MTRAVFVLRLESFSLYFGQLQTHISSYSRNSPKLALLATIPFLADLFWLIAVLLTEIPKTAAEACAF